jgi:predicted dehydrogenase
MKNLAIFLMLLLSWSLAICQSNQPIRIGVIGLSHDHVHWIFRQKNAKDFEIVGIAESDRQLAERYSKRYGFSMDIVYPGIAGND